MRRCNYNSLRVVDCYIFLDCYIHNVLVAVISGLFHVPFYVLGNLSGIPPYIAVRVTQSSKISWQTTVGGCEAQCLVPVLIAIKKR